MPSSSMVDTCLPSHFQLPLKRLKSRAGCTRQQAVENVSVYIMGTNHADIACAHRVSNWEERVSIVIWSL